MGPDADSRGALESGPLATPPEAKASLNRTVRVQKLPSSGKAVFMSDVIDFWFTMGSTYSYLSVTRLGEVQRAAGVSFRWRPFHLLLILQDMNHVPFADKPAKAAYMWRDINPIKDSLKANLVAVVGMREGWGPDFVRVAYRRWFCDGEENGSDPNISSSLREVGQEPDRVLALATSPEANALILEETNAAKRLGIFGSPTFAVGGELFWGDDRLEDAICWHKHGEVRRQH
jgi:2-hydroxychromene-2-carboxylate isomerase